MPVTVRTAHTTYTLAGTPRVGGQAEVWRAHDDDGGVVAVKIARQGSRWPRSIHEEAAGMQRVAARDPDAGRWAVPVLDVGTTDDGRPFYVMPFFARTLEDLLVGSVALLVRLDLLARACSCVERLHAASTSAAVVVHRDVKPANFLARVEGDAVDVLLSDFGGLREGALLSDATQTTLLSRAYAPPEQYLPLKAEPDPAMDVFALACVVFQGVVGADPPSSGRLAPQWHGPEATELLRLHRNRRSLSADDQARYEALRRAPTDVLLDTGVAPALSDADRRQLHAALERDLARLVPDAEGQLLADDLAQRFAAVFERALSPDPVLRLSRATPLRRACVEAHDRIAAVVELDRWTWDRPCATDSTSRWVGGALDDAPAGATAVPSQPAPTSATYALDPPTPPASVSRRTVLPWLGGGALAALGVGAWWQARDPRSSDPAAAPAGERQDAASAVDGAPPATPAADVVRPAPPADAPEPAEAAPVRSESAEAPVPAPPPAAPAPSRPVRAAAPDPGGAGTVAATVLFGFVHRDPVRGVVEPRSRYVDVEVPVGGRRTVAAPRDDVGTVTLSAARRDGRTVLTATWKGVTRSAPVGTGPATVEARHPAGTLEIFP